MNVLLFELAPNFSLSSPNRNTLRVTKGGSKQPTPNSAFSLGTTEVQVTISIQFSKGYISWRWWGCGPTYVEDRLGKTEIKAKGRYILELGIQKMNCVVTTQRKKLERIAERGTEKSSYLICLSAI